MKVIVESGSDGFISMRGIVIALDEGLMVCSCARAISVLTQLYCHHERFHKWTCSRQSIRNWRMWCMAQASGMACFRSSLWCCMFAYSVCSSCSSSFRSLLVVGLSDTWILSVYCRSLVSMTATECVNCSSFSNAMFCHICQQRFCCPSIVADPLRQHGPHVF